MFLILLSAFSVFYFRARKSFLLGKTQKQWKYTENKKNTTASNPTGFELQWCFQLAKDALNDQDVFEDSFYTWQMRYLYYIHFLWLVNRIWKKLFFLRGGNNFPALIITTRGFLDELEQSPFDISLF